jgi:hypothetical protein
MLIHNHQTEVRLTANHAVHLFGVNVSEFKRMKDALADELGRMHHYTRFVTVREFATAYGLPMPSERELNYCYNYVPSDNLLTRFVPTIEIATDPLTEAVINNSVNATEEPLGWVSEDYDGAEFHAEENWTQDREIEAMEAAEEPEKEDAMQEEIADSPYVSRKADISLETEKAERKSAKKKELDGQTSLW